MTSPSLTIDTPAGLVRATAGPRQADAVVFELGGAMRGSVHVTGTTHPRHWDQFTAVRAIDFDPWQPSSLWRAGYAARHYQTPVMPARTLAAHIRELPS
ncbi:hypothetical protein [Streptomyces bicolor]|uniref:hypothetical protein n=1 Tax=Streptomyces bicolor TaxID=66874 RepID=UPI0004E2406C|nr:hypothetical protein [Streptomyces bicolor]